VNNARLAQVQAVSGLLFSLFALVHLTNTALAFGGFLYEIDDPFDNDFARAYEAATAYFTGDES